VTNAVAGPTSEVAESSDERRSSLWNGLAAIVAIADFA
jgi:hypothetical protein